MIADAPSLPGPVTPSAIPYSHQPADPLERALIPFIVGVVGKRDLGDHAAAVEWSIREALADLRRQHPSSPLLVLTALAEGADWCAARATAALATSQEEEGAPPVRLLCPLPMQRALYEQEFSAAHREAFGRLLELGTIQTADREVTFGAGAFSYFELRPLRGAREAQMGRVDGRSQPHRTVHYEQVGLYIADACHLLVGVMPEDEKPDRVGGTARIMHYKCVGRLPPDTVESDHAGLEDLLAVLEKDLDLTPAPSRATHDEPTHRLRRLSQELPEPLPPADWFSRRGGHMWQLIPGPAPHWRHWRGARPSDQVADNRVEANRGEVLGATQPYDAYNARVQKARAKGRLDKCRRRIDEAAAGLRKEMGGEAEFDADEHAALGRLTTFRLTIAELQETAKRWTDRSLLFLALLFILTVGLFTWYKVWHAEFAAYGYLAALLAAAAWYAFAHHRQWSPVHDDYRAAAEALRVQIGWRLAGIRERAESHYRAGATQQLERVARGIETINTVVALEHRQADIAQPRAVSDFAIRQWVDSQIGFFTRKHVERHAQNERYLLMIMGLFYLGVGLFLGVIQRKLGAHGGEIVTWLMRWPFPIAAVVSAVPWAQIAAWLSMLLVPLTLLTLLAFVLRFDEALPASRGAGYVHRLVDRSRDWVTHQTRRRRGLRLIVKVYPLVWCLFPVIVGWWVSNLAFERAGPVGELDVEMRLGLAVALLNAGAAAGIYLREKLAVEPEMRNYQEMKRVFELAKSLLLLTGDSAQQRDVLIELGREALAENAYWLRAHRERPIEQIPG